MITGLFSRIGMVFKEFVLSELLVVMLQKPLETTDCL